MTPFLVRGTRTRRKDDSEGEVLALFEALRKRLESQEPSTLEYQGLRLVAHPPRMRRIFQFPNLIDGLDHVEFEIVETTDDISIQYRASVAPKMVSMSIFTATLVIVVLSGGATAVGGWYSLPLPLGLILMHIVEANLRLGSLASSVLQPLARATGPSCPYCSSR